MHELSVSALQKENTELKEQLSGVSEHCQSLKHTNTKLKGQVQQASSTLKKCGADLPPIKRTFDHERMYSDSHIRRLKRQRRSDCELSLA